MNTRSPIDTRALQRERQAADDRQRAARDREKDDFKLLMSEKWGRRIAWRLLDRCGVFRTSFTGNSETFFNEGKRNIGLMIVGEIHDVCPEFYHLMLKEQQENE